MEMSPAEQQDTLMRIDRGAPVSAKRFDWALDNGYIQVYDDDVSEDMEVELTDAGRKLIAGR